MTMGTKISRTQASLPPRKMTTAVVKRRVKACWRKSERTDEMAYWTRSMSLMSAERSVPVACFWKNEIGAAQDGLVEVVAQVGDHAEAGVVGEVGSGVVADALEQPWRRRRRRRRRSSRCGSARGRGSGGRCGSGAPNAESSVIPPLWLSAPGCRTLSKMGPTRRTRKASRRPTAAARRTAEMTCSQ